MSAAYAVLVALAVPGLCILIALCAWAYIVLRYPIDEPPQDPPRLADILKDRT